MGDYNLHPEAVPFSLIPKLVCRNLGIRLVVDNRPSPSSRLTSSNGFVCSYLKDIIVS